MNNNIQLVLDVGTCHAFQINHVTVLFSSKVSTKSTGNPPRQSPSQKKLHLLLVIRPVDVQSMNGLVFFHRRTQEAVTTASLLKVIGNQKPKVLETQVSGTQPFSERVATGKFPGFPGSFD